MVKLTRRNFLKTTGILGATPFLAKVATAEEALAAAIVERDEYPLAKPENQIYTVCLQCNTGCGIKAKILDGVCVKIDGNPYSPWTIQPHIPYKKGISDASKIEGGLCLKGQSGIQTAYDPYRITKVLKRAGKRGENKWVTIDFHKAVSEIVNGGKIFSNVPGEEDREVEGLKSLYALKDPKVMKDMAADIKEIWHKKMTVEEFKKKYAEHLKTLIDPEHPDFGPKNNQFSWIHGRLKAGRSEFFKRFVQDAFGSANFNGHTTVCQGSLYFTGKAMSDQFDYDEKDKKAKWTGGKKFYWQGDIAGSEFVIFVGASPLEANYGPSYRSRAITDGITEGRLKKIAVIDPRFSKTASKAWKWIPNKEGTEGAFALAMINWVIENKRFDAKYLSNANKAAAKKDNEPTWSNAPWLVKIKDGKPADFLRASDLGIFKYKRKFTASDGKETWYELDGFVVLKEGKPSVFDPNDPDKAEEGELFVDTTIHGIQVKSALQLLKEEASKKTVEEWASVCDVNKDDIIALADEFTKHGKKAVADIHRGVSQHTNGFYNVLAWYSLNLLIGNYDWRGGLVQASTYDIAGEKAGGPFDLKKLHPGKLSPFGISIIRHDTKYEDTTIFSGYPAKRPWFPFSSDVYQEIIPSAGDAYPYPIKALLMYMGSPIYALPAGQTNVEILADVNKIPLFIASDIIVGTTSMYSDYIFPDISYLERWEFQGSHPSITWKVQPVRQPAIPPIPETVSVFGQNMPICMESFMLAVAEKLNLSGFGPNGLGEANPLTHYDHYYLKLVANLAFGEKKDGSGKVDDASAEEVGIFLKARKHLPKAVFDSSRWQSACGTDNWKRAIYVLNRGGRFEDYEKGFDGEQVKNKYGKQINLYLEKIAKGKNSMTGKGFSGIATHLPIQDVLGRELKQSGKFQLITYREIYMTKSRTISNYWLLNLLPENFILMNASDAKGRGLKDNSLVKVVSDSNPEGIWDLKSFTKKPIVGKIKTTEGMRKGTIAFSLGYGHWATGASDVVLNGETIKGDTRRAKGIHANAAMAIDPYLKNTCLEDIVGGSVSFYDSKVSLVKI